MNPMRHFVFLGAINGFLAVAFGAFAAHALKNVLSAGLLEIFRTGVDYQALHALALSGESEYNLPLTSSI